MFLGQLISMRNANVKWPPRPGGAPNLVLSGLYNEQSL